MFSSSSSSMLSNNILLSEPALTITSILPTQTTMMCINISSDGSSIVFVNGSKNVFVSTNYGVLFTQVADLSTFVTQICISNGGKYIVALQEYDAIGWRIAVSQSYGYYWTIKSLAAEPWGNNNMCVSANGKYICMCNGGIDGIWINNNYGNSDYWVQINRDFDAYISVTQTPFPLPVSYVTISSSGQYIVATVDCEMPSYILYSSDFGVSFSLIQSNINTYGRTLRISSTGDFIIFGGFQGPTYYSKNITSTSKTFTQAASTVSTLMNASYAINSMVSNTSGSRIYFLNQDQNNGTIYLSTDNLQSATIYNNLIANIDGAGIFASSDTKYMLIYFNGNLQLITDNTLTSPMVTWPAPEILPPLTITNILPTQTTMSCFNISNDGSIIILVNTSSQVFISSNHGESFTQVTNLPSKPNQICISNNGTYIGAHIGTGLFTSIGTGNAIIISNNSGSTWTTITTLPYDIINISMSSTGKYMCASGGVFDSVSGGIWVSNDYGDNTSWTSVNTNVGTPSEAGGSSISSTGQYMMVAHTPNIPPCFFYYSNDYGSSFSQINIVTGTPGGRSTYISSTGQFAIFVGSGGGLYNECCFTNQSNLLNGICIPTTSAIKLTINNGTPNCIISNSSGSKCFWTGYSGPNSKIIYVSTDYLQTATTYTAISTSTGRICGSADTKYILTFSTVTGLQLTTDNYL